MKFKVGDKVSVTHKETLPYATEGIVMEVTTHTKGYSMYYEEYKVKCGNGIIYNHCKESDLELIEEKKEMKFKVGDIVKVNQADSPNDDKIGTIIEINEFENYHVEFKNDKELFSGHYLNLITDKKFITLSDIKKCSPCKSNEYVDLIESFLEFTEKTGKQATITYKNLWEKYPMQRNWIEKNLSQFKEEPIYTGKFKVNDTVYVDNRLGEFFKGKITEIYRGTDCFLFRIEGITFSSYKENYVYSSLSDLKKHWHQQITDIKDIEEKLCLSCTKYPKCKTGDNGINITLVACNDYNKRDCLTCKHQVIKKPWSECYHPNKQSDYSCWEAKSCSNCGWDNVICVEKVGSCENWNKWKAKEEEKSCNNCKHCTDGWCLIKRGNDCITDNKSFRFWEAKEERHCHTCNNCSTTAIHYCVKGLFETCYKSNFQYWVAKKKNLCDKCICTCKVIPHAEKMISCMSFEMKGCNNCGVNGDAMYCYRPNNECWKPKEK